MLADGVRPQPPGHPLRRCAPLDGPVELTEGRPLVGGMGLFRPSRHVDGSEGVRGGDPQESDTAGFQTGAHSSECQVGASA
jgi:hypothetical protein